MPNIISDTYRIYNIYNENQDAVKAGIALDQARKNPELWYANLGAECDYILWPKDRLHGLAHIIEEKRSEDVIWCQPPPEGFIESALWGLKRVQSSLSQKYNAIQWGFSTFKTAVAPVVNNLDDVQFTAEYYKEHPTLIKAATSGYFTYAGIKDYFDRRNFKNNHSDYMVDLDAEKYEDKDLTWVKVPTGLEREIYNSMKDIPKETEDFKAETSKKPSFIRKLINDYKILNARKEAKKQLMNETEFPGFSLLPTKKQEEITNSFAKTLLDKKENFSDQITYLKQIIANSATELKLKHSKKIILNDLERTPIKDQNFQTELNVLKEQLTEEKKNLNNLQKEGEHESDLITQLIKSLKIIYLRSKTQPELENKIPLYRDQLNDAIAHLKELTSQRNYCRTAVAKLNKKIKIQNEIIARSSEPYSNPIIQSFISQLATIDINASDYIKETIKNAPTEASLNDLSLKALLNSATHPNFKNLPDKHKDLLFFYIINHKGGPDEAYDNFIKPMLDLATPGINLIEKNKKEKWYDDLFDNFKKSDSKSHPHKILNIKNHVLADLKEIAVEQLNLSTNAYWQEQVEKLNLLDIADLNVDQESFNASVIENQVLKKLIETLVIELQNKGEITKETKSKIPELINENTNDFFEKLTQARDILKQEKENEMEVLSTPFQKMYEHNVASVLMQTTSTTSEEMTAVKAEIDRIAMRSKLSSLVELLVPFVLKDTTYQNLPSEYKSRVLDNITCAKNVENLVAQWELIPKKLDLLNTLSQHSKISMLPIEQKQKIIEKIALSNNKEELIKNYKKIMIDLKKIEAPQKTWGSWFADSMITVANTTMGLDVYGFGETIDSIDGTDPTPHQDGSYNAFERDKALKEIKSLLKSETKQSEQIINTLDKLLEKQKTMIHSKPKDSSKPSDPKETPSKPLPLNPKAK